MLRRLLPALLIVESALAQAPKIHHEFRSDAVLKLDLIANCNGEPYSPLEPKYSFPQFEDWKARPTVTCFGLPGREPRCSARLPRY